MVKQLGFWTLKLNSLFTKVLNLHASLTLHIWHVYSKTFKSNVIKNPIFFNLKLCTKKSIFQTSKTTNNKQNKAPPITTHLFQNGGVHSLPVWHGNIYSGQDCSWELDTLPSLQLFKVEVPKFQGDQYSFHSEILCWQRYSSDL